jgi:mannose-6-phosphate isomerase-like protein (cupin superfamily)
VVTWSREQGATVQAVNLKRKLASFAEVWSPKVVGELNGQWVKLVKFEGEYVWHSHAEEDELFLVLEGRITIHFRDRAVTLDEGEFCIVPRGVEHKPVAESRASVLLFEPATTRNTGSVDHEYTIEASDLERI